MATNNNNDNQQKQNNHQGQPLLTAKSVAISLSPPRIAPHGTNLRQLYTTHYHPHLPSSLSIPDQVTRFIGATLPLNTQHSFRDNGYLRSVADTAVNLSCPLMGLGHWREVLEFIELSRNSGDAHQHDSINRNRNKSNSTRRKRWTCKRIPYGEHHPMQYIDLFLPTTSTASTQCKNTISNKGANDDRIPVRGTLFFIHGGAWGAGQPWMYRLVAPTFLKLNFAVVIVGYRTYPDAQCVIDDQTNDVILAWNKCEHILNECVVPVSNDDEWVGNVIMGHSSGAHVGLLMLVDWIGEQMKKHNDGGSVSTSAMTNTAKKKYPWRPNYFIGLSGPYDISYHFDYEGGRGVEQISPLKPICGHTRESFDNASPVKRLMALLCTQNEGDDAMQQQHTLQQYMPPILLVHGIEDTTVPFTATSDAGKMLRSCGINICDEIYLMDTGHQDVIMHFMMGGCAKEIVLEWLLKCSSSDGRAEDKKTAQLKLQSRL